MSGDEACEEDKIEDPLYQIYIKRKRNLMGRRERQLNKENMEMSEGKNRKEQIQTDGQRHRSTEESSAWFATRFIGDSLWRLVVNRPACKNEYKREEEKKQERDTL